MLRSITILPGVDKNGAAEPFDRVVLKPREVYAIVGNTGSGKSRFISDIEQNSLSAYIFGEKSGKDSLNMMNEKGAILVNGASQSHG